MGSRTGLDVTEWREIPPGTASYGFSIVVSSRGFLSRDQCIRSELFFEGGEHIFPTFIRLTIRTCIILSWNANNFSKPAMLRFCPNVTQFSHNTRRNSQVCAINPYVANP